MSDTNSPTYIAASAPILTDEFLGAVVCSEQDGLKRWHKRPGETVQLKAHVWNFGDTASGAFAYRWLYDGAVISTGRHDGLGVRRTRRNPAFNAVARQWKQPDHCIRDRP